MLLPRFVTACGFATLVLVGLSTQHDPVAAAQEESPERVPGRPFDCDTASCAEIARGFHAFFDRQLPGLQGNGRACADCHMASDSFQLSPAGVEARFQQLTAQRRVHPDADDPLFRPIDADDFRTNGDSASDFSKRAASITMATPAALSVAPLPRCQESRCAPITTTSVALSDPLISPTTLKAV